MEGNRILKDDGVFIIQDRTLEDCMLKGDDTHVRGYFTELFPKLANKEEERGHGNGAVTESLRAAGFTHIEEVKLWETRAVHSDKSQLLNDVANRTGRSILHELDDNELKILNRHLDQSILTEGEIVEKDRWTIWKAVK